MNFGPFIIAFEISCNHSYHHAYNYLRTILNTILHLGFLYKNRMVRFVKPKYPIFPENSNLQYVVSNLFSISHILFPLPHKPYIPFYIVRSNMLDHEEERRVKARHEVSQYYQ
jgi:hypothetical protein